MALCSVLISHSRFDCNFGGCVRNRGSLEEQLLFVLSTRCYLVVLQFVECR